MKLEEAKERLIKLIEHISDYHNFYGDNETNVKTITEAINIVLAELEEKEKENQKLDELANKLHYEHETTFKEWLKDIKDYKELREEKQALLNKLEADFQEAFNEEKYGHWESKALCCYIKGLAEFIEKGE